MPTYASKDQVPAELPARGRGASIIKDANVMRADMMNITKDIHPLTEFKRNTTELVRQLRETGQPIVLTINGRAELVVQDAGSYQRLIDLVDRLEAIAGIRKGLEESKRGEGQPIEDAVRDIRKEVETPSAE